jgi:hypothetical protein
MYKRFPPSYNFHLTGLLFLPAFNWFPLPLTTNILFFTFGAFFQWNGYDKLATILPCSECNGSYGMISF